MAITNPLEQITKMARDHPAAHWVYPNGKAPLGYIKGVALVYGRVLCRYHAGDAAALFMARASTGNSAHDALSYYRGEFNKLALDVSKDGLDTLRSLWVLVTGLAMPESSGDDDTGRDRSANNVTAETAEAGAWQTSWNAAHNSGPPATGLLTALFAHYKKAFAANPAIGWADVFREGCPPPRASELQNYGTGDGAEFQKLTKECPAFGAEFAAIVLRALRGHYGTINRYKVALNPHLADMLREVERIIATDPATFAAALSDTQVDHSETPILRPLPNAGSHRDTAKEPTPSTHAGNHPIPLQPHPLPAASPAPRKSPMTAPTPPPAAPLQIPAPLIQLGDQAGAAIEMALVAAASARSLVLGQILQTVLDAERGMIRSELSGGTLPALPLSLPAVQTAIQPLILPAMQDLLTKALPTLEDIISKALAEKPAA